MNADVSRTILTRVILVAAGAGVMGYFVVQPKSNAALQAKQTYFSHHKYIEQGEGEMSQRADEVESLVEDMRHARDSMIEDLSPDESVQAHQRLQRLATDRGLTVTRVEPTKSSIKEAKTGEPEQVVRIETKEFRIECHGAYSGLIAFIDDIHRSSGQPRVSNFRMIPTDENRVRASLTISLIELVEFPEQIKNAFEDNTDHAEIGAAEAEAGGEA